MLLGDELATASINHDVFRGLDGVAGESITPAEHLPVRRAEQFQRHLTNCRHSIATCWIGILAIAGKISSYCRHSLTSVWLPVGIGL